MDKTNKIPQAVIDELQPQEGYSHIVYSHSENGINYYALAYDKERDFTGLPQMIGYKNGQLYIVRP